MVLPDSRGISRVPRYSGSVLPQAKFRLQGSYLLRPAFPDRSPTLPRSHSWTSHNPGVHALRFRLLRVRSPLLTESLLFSFPQGTEMFQFPWCAPVMPMDSACSAWLFAMRVPPFGHPRIDARLQLPEALSLFATSFFGSWRPGIPRALFFPYPCYSFAIRFSRNKP